MSDVAANGPPSDVKMANVSDVKMAAAATNKISWRTAPGGRVLLGPNLPLYPMLTDEVWTLIERLYRDVWGSDDLELDADGLKRVEQAGASLLFGEVLPQGVAKMCDDQHLRAAQAKVVFDFGAGRGKLLLQASSIPPRCVAFLKAGLVLQIFLCYGGVVRAMGVELARSRFLKAASALRLLWSELPSVFAFEQTESVVRLTMKQTFDPAVPTRTLEFHHGDIFDFVKEVPKADILIVETQLDAKGDGKSAERLVPLLSMVTPGARFLTYNRLRALKSLVDRTKCTGCASVVTVPHELFYWRCPVYLIRTRLFCRHANRSLPQVKQPEGRAPCALNHGGNMACVSCDTPTPALAAATVHCPHCRTAIAGKLPLLCFHKCLTRIVSFVMQFCRFWIRNGTVCSRLAIPRYAFVK